MLSSVRSVGAAFQKCALLFLALSIFWFALHARLESVRLASSNVTATKVFTGKHSADPLNATHKQATPAFEADALVLAFLLYGAYREAARLPLSELAKIELADPRGLHQFGVYSLHGPPATTL
jgi:hypothetical protein